MVECSSSTAGRYSKISTPRRRQNAQCIHTPKLTLTSEISLKAAENTKISTPRRGQNAQCIHTPKLTLTSEISLKAAENTKISTPRRHSVLTPIFS
ncbi:DnaJ [Trichinella spiralis]|uniref:DnaJ n=1 Tax=Trichinella spiralis TaxID=6334 RepID=A0ABR3KDL8_TRISP